MEKIEYVPKNQAIKNGYYIFRPTWFSYDDRPERVTKFVYQILSFLPWYKVNFYNGYLIKTKEPMNSIYFSDFTFNPWEKTDAILREQLNFK